MKKIIRSFGKTVLATITKISPTAGCYILYFMRTKTIPNIKNPKNFNEKMTHLKLNDYANNDLVIRCTDKIAAREFIKSKGYENILNELYGTYDTFDDIDFSALPDQFAIKCNHGCAYNIICSDKQLFDKSSANEKTQSWMKEKYGYATQELHYTKIQPRILCEKYLCDKNGLMPTDYKLYCFNGKVRAILVCTERDNKLRLNYFNTSWDEMLYGKESYRSLRKIKKPKSLKKMIKISEELSTNFPFVRVDLYDKDGAVIFGELTFTPACSCAPYYTKTGLMELGKLLQLKVKS